MTRKLKTTTYCVADAISNGVSDLNQLREELQDWYDNLPENFQNGEKGDRLQEALDNLQEAESFDEPDCVCGTTDPEDEGAKGCMGNLRFEMIVGKRAKSRRERRDEACGLLRCALDAIREELERTDNDDERLDPYVETRADIEAACDDVERVCDGAEDADFPTMYG